MPNAEESLRDIDHVSEPATAARVYRYGLLPPIEGAERVRQQLHAAHVYRNALVEIERGRRAARRAVLAEHGDLPGLESNARETQMDLDRALFALRAARSATHSRSDQQAMRDAVVAARATCREALRRLREARRTVEADPVLQTRLRAADVDAVSRTKTARANADVYWGTYLLVEDAASRSRKMPLYDGLEANDPRFVRFDGQGRVGVQLQGGLSVPELDSGEDTRVRVEHVGPVWHLPRRRPPKGAPKAQHVLWLRVGSDGRAPVWARFPMILHRPLPHDGTIKWATVVLRRYATREEWAVVFTVLEPERERSCGRGAVAIDLGWRTVPEGLRVAVAQGEGGEPHACVLPASWSARMNKAGELRTLRDEKFNAARDALKKRMDAIAVLPDWLTERTKHLSDWRSQGRLAKLTQDWRHQRFEGDATAFLPLDNWRHRDRHLWQYECGVRRKALLDRRERYRVFAATLAKRYGTVVLEAFDLRAVAKAPVPEVESAENASARRHRHWAAVSELRTCLVEAMRRRGGDVVVVPAANSTRTCHVCGLIEAFDAADSIHHACSGCGSTWDQDDNAAAVLLTRWREGRRAPPKTGRARDETNPSESAIQQESRWTRARRMAAEKRDTAPRPRRHTSNVAKP